MRLSQLRESWLVAIVCTSLACGCGGSDKSGGGNGSNTKSADSPASGTPPGNSGGAVGGDDLKQLAITYLKFQKTGNRRAPTGWKELIAFASANGQDASTLKRVQDGGYEVYWNVRIRDAKIGLSRFVLAYRPSDGATGGLVLMYNGLAKQVSASELKSMLARQDPTKAAGALDPVPAGGKLVSLGDGRFALKVIDDRRGDMILAYVVNASGRQRVAIKAKTITIHMGGRTTTFATYRDINDPAASTTRYALAQVTAIEMFRKGGPARFEVEINGQKLQGAASF